MEIEFQGHYDKTTIFKAVSLANQPSKRKTLFRISLVVLILVIFIGYLITVAYKESLSSFDSIRVSRIFISFFFIGYFLLQPYISAYITALKLWKDPAMKNLLAGTASNQAINFISSTKGRKEITKEITWERFTKKRTAENLIVLLTDEGILSFYPRHFFKTEGDWQRMRQLVDLKVVEAI